MLHRTSFKIPKKGLWVIWDHKQIWIYNIHTWLLMKYLVVWIGYKV